MRMHCVAACLAAFAFLPSSAVAQKVRDRELTPIRVDGSETKTPIVAFTETADDRQGYDKYFYFVREGTSFAEAYSDIRECDALARGVAYYLHNEIIYSPAIGGLVGGAIGNLVADAVFGSAVRRQMRRTNLRTCMGYKGYSRHGLPKVLWQKFNFEEGNRTVPEEERQSFLQMQAKAAISGKPQTQELEF